MSEIYVSSNIDLLSQHNEWYSRGYLPHRNKIGLLQFIAWCIMSKLCIRKEDWQWSSARFR